MKCRDCNAEFTDGIEVVVGWDDEYDEEIIAIVCPICKSDNIDDNDEEDD